MESMCRNQFFQKLIDIASQQKDTEKDNTFWAASNLKKVLKPTSSGSSDSDSLMVNVGSMTAAAPASVFSLESACITVTQADCNERCANNVCTAQSTAADSTQSAYSRLSHTETDLVLRGEFTNSDVDSDVNIITKYVECPLSISNEATGYLRAGATIDCDNAITSGLKPSPTVANEQDCTQAFTTDLGTAEVKLYITNTTSSSHLLTAGEATAASTANWRIRHADIYINGTKSSSTAMKVHNCLVRDFASVVAKVQCTTAQLHAKKKQTVCLD